MIDKEKVVKLAMKLRNSYVNQYENVINEWLEQNQPEPVAVGLSDDQFMDFCKNRTKAECPKELLRRFKVWQSETFPCSSA